MNEQLLQFIWRFQYFNKLNLFTIQGEPIEIIHPGSMNTNQGPDFQNAKIKIGDTLWAGTVELHLKTSDWQKHGHQQDANYTNVILHVVFENDLDESHLPVLELRGEIPGQMITRYISLMQSRCFLACESLVQQVNALTIENWKDRLVAERLQRKTDLVWNDLQKNNHHWEQTFWCLLARNFGTKTNAETFEAIAKTISINILARHKSNLIQLEALLLGQAGLLSADNFQDKYPQMLKKEYLFLKSKYQLQTVAFPVYFLRMRPGNFPTVRLAQLAALIHNSAHLFSRIIETPDLVEVKKWFKVAPNDFWNYHYTLSDEAQLKQKALGDDMVSNIIVNTVVPMLFTYGKVHSKEHIKQKAFLWLQQTTAEKNNISKGFKQIGLFSKNAYDSQAFIELKTQYCDLKKCLNCSIGNAVIKSM